MKKTKRKSVTVWAVVCADNQHHWRDYDETPWVYERVERAHRERLQADVDALEMPRGGCGPHRLVKLVEARR